MKALHRARLKQLRLGTLDHASSTITEDVPTSVETNEMTCKILENDTTKVVKILELTEKELFECKMQLKAKVQCIHIPISTDNVTLCYYHNIMIII